MRAEYNRAVNFQKRVLKKRGGVYDVTYIGYEDSYILKSAEGGRLSEAELNAAYKTIKKKVKKLGEVIQVVIPFIGLMKKPAEVRMGKGKGVKIDKWVYAVRPGAVLFEVRGAPEHIALKGLREAKQKLSIKSRIFY